MTTEKTANLSEIEIARLRRRITELERELERWRHGQEVEGDYVCPDSLALVELRRVVREQVGQLKLLQADMAGDVNVWPGFTDSVRVIESVLRSIILGGVNCTWCQSPTFRHDASCPVLSVERLTARVAELEAERDRVDI